MKFIENIKESTIKLLLSSLFAFLGFLAGTIYSETIQTFLPAMLQATPKSLILKLLIMATTLFFLMSVLSLYLYLKNKKKLIPKCGVLWDKNKEPYCPACEIPMSEYYVSNSQPNEMYEITCIKCNAHIRLMHNGQHISLQNAQKLLNA